MHLKPPPLLAVAAVLAFGLTGCGDRMAQVSGTVKLNGELVESGSIRFEPVDQSHPPEGGVIANGDYSAKMPPGEMKVSFTITKVVGKKKAYGDAPDSPEIPMRADVTPERYTAAKTEQRYEVKPGVNQKDWELTAP
jgi:hypothetical protein